MALTKVSRGLLSTGIVDNSTTTAITIDSSENVGIGTSSPSTKLEVLDANGVGLRFGDIASTPSAQTAGYVGLSTSAYSGNNGDLVLIPRTSSASNILLMEGNVGIGVSASLQGQLNVGGDAGGDPSMYVFGSRGAADNLPAGHLTFRNVANGVGDVNLSRIQSLTGTGSNQTQKGQLAFSTNDGSSLTERMRIDSSGNLLVGTTSTADTDAGAKILSAGIMVQGVAGVGLVDMHDFYRGTAGSLTRVGNIRTNGSSTSYNTSSDYRLKENVVAMSGATERLKQLNPSRFNFIADADTTVDGFLAHEVQAVVPEAITGTKDAMRDEEYEVTPAVLDDDGNVTTEAVMGTRSVPDYQGIDQSKLVPLLVATIQELEARLTALENN